MANIQKDQSSQKEQNTNKTHEQQIQEGKRKTEVDPNNPVAGSKQTTQTETDNQRKAGFHSASGTEQATSKGSRDTEAINWKDNDRTDRSQKSDHGKTNERATDETRTDDEDAALEETSPGKTNKDRGGL